MRFYRIAVFALLVWMALLPSAVMAADEEEFSAVHHSADGYYVDFSPLGKVELPRIFLVRGEEGGLGLDVFASTKAALRSGAYDAVLEGHGAESGDAEATAEHPTSPSGHGMGAFTAEEVNDLVASGEHIYATLVPADGGTIVVDFSITRHLVFALLGAFIVAALFIGLARRYKRGVGRETAPKGIFQNMMETVIIFIRDEVAKPNLGDRYPKFLPYLLTLFFFILTCNLLGLVPFGATATSNLTITAVLALFTFAVTQLSASKEHWKHVFNPPVPVLMKPIMIPVEIIGLFTKPFALAVRLFANMTAGHLVILSLIGLIFTFTNLFGAGVGYGVAFVSVAFSLFIYLLEILVALIQAYIFTVLSALFIGMAIEEHAHEEYPELAEGDTPELHGPDRSQVTPHLLGGDDRVEERTRVRDPEPVAS